MPVTRYYERQLAKKGFSSVAGVDEVGCGALAGPVVAAAVILPDRHGIRGIDDSKRLASAVRAELFEYITARATAWAFHTVASTVVDTRGLRYANVLAIKQAVNKLSAVPDFILVDALPIRFRAPSRSIINGDAISESIAAASIVAKVLRDRMMETYDTRFPGYAFSAHKGYGTPQHLHSLRALGICAIHRTSFAPVKELVEKSVR